MGGSGDNDLGVTGRDEIDEIDGDNGVVDSGFLRNQPVRTAWRGPTQLLLLLLESSRWTRENPDKIR